MNKKIGIIDSHQHVWKLSRGDYGWLTPELEVLYRDFMPCDYERDVKKLGIKYSILVQAADTIAETEFMLNLAKKTPFIAGVVGWVDMDSDDGLEQLETLSGNPYFKGIRPMLQDIKDTDWIVNPKFDAIFQCLAKKGLTFDALITGRHIENIKAIAEKYPSLKIVIDHCAKPDIASGDYASWADGIESLRGLENIYVKFSGLTTEASQGDTAASSYKPYFDHMLSIFGIDRILWGSDWPVIKLKSDTEAWIEICHETLQAHPIADQQKIWSGNAHAFYNLQID